ncbi:TonB-dependent receptor plug domain-containing protein [uncultured Roseivirga sp.]|uniref:TonB-dependent receptor plug domain-containing protein n=1 Tax=uncultured Roseivirga sp. TaxID=543088 RepID=UPI0030DDC319|tara:strand:+ start:216 stop:614 length:399 start_codon:yes stop_codon:yes gene_type:complete
MKTAAIISFFILCAFLFTQCASQSSIAQDRAKPTQEYEQYTSLYQALKSVPGVSVTGSEANANIALRGGAYGYSNPLFVIDNVIVGNYSRANAMVLPSNIKSIKVLNGLSATNIYGLEASSGVILIRTKASE